MKTQEEIEQLANEWSDDYEKGAYRDIAKRSYIIAYTQYQEDMVDKKYTEQDIIKAIQYGIDIEAGNIKFNYKKYPDSFTQYIKSLNKQG